MDVVNTTVAFFAAVLAFAFIIYAIRTVVIATGHVVELAKYGDKAYLAYPPREDECDTVDRLGQTVAADYDCRYEY